MNSWKEIAAYLGRGVRTVQRWERELGLPVRRPRGKERSAVIALTPDLDRWLHNVPQGTLISQPSNGQKREKLHLSTERLLAQIHEMAAQSRRMQEIARTTVILTSKLREQQSQRKQDRLGMGERRTILLSKPSELSSRAAGGTTTVPGTPAQNQKSAVSSGE